MRAALLVAGQLFQVVVKLTAVVHLPIILTLIHWNDIALSGAIQQFNYSCSGTIHIYTSFVLIPLAGGPLRSRGGWGWLLRRRGG